MSCSGLEHFSWAAETIDGLRRRLSRMPSTFSVLEEPELAAMIASYGIQREIGSVNDDLAPFLYDRESSKPVDKSSLRSEIVQWRKHIGVRIWSTESNRLDLRLRWLSELLHPAFCFNADESLHQLVFFPEFIAKITALQGVQLVIVKQWALNTVFGEFDPHKRYYQANSWELKNNDGFVFANMVRQNRLTLLGTHDLVSHVPGVRAEKWAPLREDAECVYRTIANYLGELVSPSISALVLPYVAGTLLDDLAQPPNYGSRRHRVLLKFVLEAMDAKAVSPFLPLTLKTLPTQFDRILSLSRDVHAEITPEAARREVWKLAAEIVGKSA